MSSFYGPIGIRGSGGSGTTDYNELINTPITNVSGLSEDLFLNLRYLECGEYSLTGYFKTNALGDTRHAETPISLLVTLDTSTGDKIIQYTEVRDKETYLHTISYDSESS